MYNIFITIGCDVVNSKISKLVFIAKRSLTLINDLVVKSLLTHEVLEKIFTHIDNLKIVDLILTLDELNRRYVNTDDLTWGYECEYRHNHFRNYVSKYLLLLMLEVVLNGKDDGSGPREINSPPMNIFSIDELKLLTTALYILKIDYVSEYDGIPCGRHIHINIFQDNEYSMYLKFARLIPLLTPLMANKIDENGKFMYRSRASYYARARIYYKYIDKERRYYFITYNPKSPRGTFEIRLNEASPIEAWFVALTTVVLAKHGAKGLGSYRLSLSSIQELIEEGASFDTVLTSVTGRTFKLIEGFEALTNYVIDKVCEIDENLAKLCSKIVENVKNYRKVITYSSIRELYPELLINEVVEELDKPLEIIVD